MSERIVLIIILTLASGFFSCSETALFSLSRSEVAGFKSSKGRFSRFVIDALSKPRQLLVSILLGNEVVNVAISILVAALMYDILPDLEWQSKVIISVAVSTPIIVVIGEVIPKNIGIRYASLLASICAVFILMFSKVLTPLRTLLLKLADTFISFFGGRPEDIRSMIMEEEFRSMVDLGCEEGTIGDAEGELIHNVFDLADRTADSVMTPKEGIFALSLGDDFANAMNQIRTTQFSRIPVYDTDPDDIVGILHIRDLFSVMRRRKIVKVRDVENIIRPAHFVPVTSTLEQILGDFQRMKIQMAVVVDDRRKPVGIITMEDIFGAIFGGE